MVGRRCCRHQQVFRTKGLCQRPIDHCGNRRSTSRAGHDRPARRSALGQIGGSITLGHGVVGDAGGPNFGGDQEGRGADDILGGPELHGLLGTAFINAERMYCCSHCNENLQATARSKHPDGVQVTMLDGSVRFVSDTIDPSTWHAMHARETPGTVLEERSRPSSVAGSGLKPLDNRNLKRRFAKARCQTELGNERSRTRSACG